jgi:hypothetical protein
VADQGHSTSRLSVLWRFEDEAQYYNTWNVQPALVAGVVLIDPMSVLLFCADGPRNFFRTTCLTAGEIFFVSKPSYFESTCLQFLN